MERYLHAKSIHIFGLPFQINDDIEKFWEKVEKAGYQQKLMDCNSMTVGDNATQQEWQNAFMLNQYLSVAGRDVFINTSGKICRVYQLPKEKLADLDYYIHAVWNENQKKNYYLPIEAIELQVYSCGVGILFLQLLNEAKDSTIEDIKRINDYGRRVSLPYLLEVDDVDKHWEYSIVAKEVGIVKRTSTKDGKKIVKRNTIDFAECNKIFFQKNGENGKSLFGSAPFLMDLLNGNPLGDEVQEQIDEQNISYHTDDRMFSLALIRDDELSKEIKSGQWLEEEQEKFYSIIYVDAKSASCTDEEMRKNLLSEAVYSRWLGAGTLYAATNYSMICITSEGEGINASVVRPFVVEYKYIVSLVIAQKLGIVKCANDTGKLAEHADGKDFGNKKVEDLFQLQRKYIVLKNQLLVIEISCQEQGIEIYHMLQKQMLIEQEKAQLDELLTGMHEMADVSRNRKMDNTALVLSVMALVISLGQILREIIECFM